MVNTRAASNSDTETASGSVTEDVEDFGYVESCVYCIGNCDLWEGYRSQDWESLGSFGKKHPEKQAHKLIAETKFV